MLDQPLYNSQGLGIALAYVPCSHQLTLMLSPDMMLLGSLSVQQPDQNSYLKYCILANLTTPYGVPVPGLEIKCPSL